MESGTCLGCGERILWAVTEHGKRIPLNKPEKRFILVHVRNVEHGDYFEARMRETYISHFATCPKAPDFRKEKADG